MPRGLEVGRQVGGFLMEGWETDTCCTFRPDKKMVRFCSSLTRNVCSPPLCFPSTCT